jgi:hypothetical protein
MVQQNISQFQIHLFDKPRFMENIVGQMVIKIKPTFSRNFWDQKPAMMQDVMKSVRIKFKSIVIFFSR